MRLIKVLTLGIYRLVYRIPFAIQVIYYWRDSIGNYRLRKWKRVRANSSIIKVAFIVQMPSLWDKVKPVFDQMQIADRFEPWLILVPAYDFANNNLKDDYGEIERFINALYPNANCLRATEAGKVIDLKNYQFDFVFYQRCYEDYIPKEFHTVNVIEYARTCYIPYCFHCLKDSIDYYETSFFRNLYVLFSCDEEQKKLSKTFSIRKNEYLGFPALDEIQLCEQSENIKRVLWTPRWSEDMKFGGTCFYKYRDHIIDLAELEDIDVTIRPHPLTFDNAVKEGKMTEKEVAEYRYLLMEKNINIDTHPLIEDTFKKTDVLITDFSSIIISFFLTGKPMIYCGGLNVNFTSTLQDIIDSSYVAESWEDVVRYVKMLNRGEDPLREKRMQVIGSIIGEKRATEKILRFLENEVK